MDWKEGDRRDYSYYETAMLTYTLSSWRKVIQKVPGENHSGTAGVPETLNSKIEAQSVAFPQDCLSVTILVSVCV